MLLGIQRGNHRDRLGDRALEIAGLVYQTAERVPFGGDPRPQFLDVTLGLEDSPCVRAPASGHA